MDRERWHRIQALFEATRDLDPDERRRHLERACPDDPDLRDHVERMVRHDTADDGTLEGVVAEVAQETRGDDLAGRALGPYRVVRMIGSGGMGSVWLAERDDEVFQKRVAIKVMHRGLIDEHWRQRFDAERRILASLEHPGIARMLDGGTTEEGWPYVVMELVEGVPVDKYCLDRKAGVDERLGLFRKICDAVHYAHRNLVVHRDLKPGNVLVTADGQPKLLDFGIAKLLDPSAQSGELLETGTAIRLLTPEYASPEQVRGEAIGTSSDVYSLGVLLFEILTGRKPYKIKSRLAAELERIICEQDPERPSTITEPGALKRRLAGDIDNIVLKAMRKEPERRYASAMQLGEDIERHQDGLPVTAQPPAFGYRAGKFVRRNRLAVGAFAVALATLIGATAFSSWQAVRATRAERDAAEERDTAQAINDFLIEDLLSQANPLENQERDMTVLELLERSSETIGDRFEGRPLVEAAIRVTIRSALLNLTDYEAALPHAERAWKLYREHAGERHEKTVIAYCDYARTLENVGRLDEAEVALNESTALAREVLGDEHHKTWDAISNQAFFYADHRGGDGDEKALEILSEIVEISRHVSDPDDPSLLTALNNYGSILWENDRLEEAETIYLDVLERRRRTVGEDHPHTINSLNNLGSVYNFMDDGARAEPLFRQSIEGAERVLGPNHRLVVIGYPNLGEALSRQGKVDEAVEAYGIGVERAMEGFGDHYLTVVCLRAHGNMLRNAKRFEEAEARLFEAETMVERTFDPDHPQVRLVQDAIALNYEAWGKPEKAAPYRELIKDK